MDEKIELMCQYQPAIPRLGIRAHKQGTEAAHGMAWLGEATSFPQPIGLACTWNPELMQEIGDVIGTEARAFYKKNPEINGLTLWALTVDMERDPRWGRTEEAYGEDPYLTGKLASQFVKGLQGDHPFYFKAVATLKPYDRSSYVLSTKVYFPMGEGSNERGLSRKHIMEQCEASLRRLGVDYIDIFVSEPYI